MKRTVIICTYMFIFMSLNISLSANEIDEKRAHYLHVLAGSNYMKGNYKEAVKGFKLAKKYGEKEANYYLSMCYLLGHGVNKNLKKALYYAEEGTKVGDTLSILTLAQYYNRGTMGVTDYSKAVKLYKKIEDKSLTALKDLGMMYVYGGYGIKPDHTKSYKYWHKCATNKAIKAKDSMGQELAEDSACQSNLDVLCSTSPEVCR